MNSKSFFSYVSAPLVPTSPEAINKSRDNIYKMITKLSRELRQSKNLQLRHTKERKIEALKLILEAYDQLTF